MLQPEARPSNHTGEPENVRGCCPGRPRRRSHGSTTVHSALPLRLVTVTDASGQPQLRLQVVKDEAVDPAIELQKRAI